MQTLKLEVRQRIVDAALLEFFDEGFEKASLRKIAKNANMTVGNIYAYFKDKSALLDAVMEPIISDFNKLVVEISSKNDNTLLYLRKVSKQIVHIYRNHRYQIMILMRTMKNEKYINYRSMLSDTIAKVILSEIDSVKNIELAKLISNSVISGILTCFDKMPALSDEEAEELLFEYFSFMFHVEEVA